MEQDTSVSDTQSSNSSVETDKSDHAIIEEKIGEHDFGQQSGELAPIPTLKELTALAAITDNAVRMIQEFTVYSQFYRLSIPLILK